jgi:flagellar hook assembly protein FlgD
MPINLSIYNLKGQHVKCLHQGTISGDEASFMWDGSDSANNSVASGVYFYRYKQGNTLISKRLLLIR